jgi:hypothetical protein
MRREPNVVKTILRLTATFDSAGTELRISYSHEGQVLHYPGSKERTRSGMHLARETLQKILADLEAGERYVKWIGAATDPATATSTDGIQVVVRRQGGS